jgi:agmatine deiminase
MNQTPAALGYRMPAEWEPHEATWIAWPHNQDDWPGKFAPIPWVYAEIVRHLSQVETVRILVDGRRTTRQALKHLSQGGADLARVEFHKAPTDRVWCRDFGPNFVIKGSGDPAIGVVDWRFNAWAKYDNFSRDGRVTRILARRLGMPRWKPWAEIAGRKVRVVLEGGAIDVNGRGTLLTTEECLLGAFQARNPGLVREDLEQLLADFLGIRRVIWLGRGIAGDDTHGHVDDIARFVAPDTVLAAIEPNASDPNHEPLNENLERLNGVRDQDGRPLHVVTLPMPEPVFFDGQRLPASYANFYVANGLVLVPTFNDPNDRKALEIIASLFKDRRVVGIHSVDLLWGLGTIHCLTHEQPATLAVREAGEMPERE